MAEKNFTIKVTLDEANQIRDSLRFHQEAIMSNIEDATDSDRHKVGVIDTLLRRDFG